MRTVASLIVLVLAGASAHAVDLEPFLTGELADLERPETPVNLSALPITYLDGSEHTLAAKHGKVLLVNLWARWCIPCKDEMQDFVALQRDLGDDRFEVVALPMKKRSAKSSRKILKKWGAGSLEAYGNDPQTLARVLYDEGLFTETSISFVYPTTYVVDKKGEIVAIREGFLHWDTPEVRALIAAMKNDEP